MTYQETRCLARKFRRDLGIGLDGAVRIDDGRVFVRNFPYSPSFDSPPRTWPSVPLGEYHLTLDAIRTAILLDDVLNS